MTLLHEGLSAAAARTPEAIAVSDAAGEMTYGALSERADLMAAALRNFGVRRGDRVLLWAEKSAEVIAAMHACLRIGAAYVPVDPVGPLSRLAKIADDAAASVIVTTPEKANALSSIGLKDVVQLVLTDPGHPQSPEVRATSQSKPEVVATAPDDLAYILYTSGSTGTPKGVCISHRNAMAFVRWAVECFEINADDRISNHAPFHFDLSVFDLYAAFKVGAEVHIIPENVAYAAGPLVDFLHERNISVWYSVPSVLVMMIENAQLLERVPPHLRVLLFAGEPFPIKHLRRLRDAFAGVRMSNLYGPTETNVCTYYEVLEIAPECTTPVPIGRACSGNMVWAQLPDGARCAAGEEGELFVSGPTVMLGYHGGAPQGKVPYGTGDLVRELADGNFHYVGRRDDMLKIRGYRIERGEVEAALLEHPNLREVAVIAHGQGVDAVLWAFIVAKSENKPTILELKAHCAVRLPRYMIIDGARSLDCLPLLHNGKVDRFALSALLRPEEE